ncbi:MAG TPA: hypothetical protein VFX16_15495 [Pseudonocardiaceae bacterium]|nr:hypothetical protein [Pseudonocardiaceae bacterium]
MADEGPDQPAVLTLAAPDGPRRGGRQWLTIGVATVAVATSGYGRASDGTLMGQIHLDRGHGMSG